MTRVGTGARGLGQARETVTRLFDAAVTAVDPDRAVREALSLCDGAIVVSDKRIEVANRIHIVAIGKAAVAMTRGALKALGGVKLSGDVITKDGHADGSLPASLRVHEAGHPIPDDRGVRATSEMLRALETLENDAAVLALISGGGSALLEAPREGLSLHELAQTTNLLLRAGAPIEALNSVRAPLSRVKAGGLRAAAPGATWVTLILSDVLGNDPRVIASGPTVPGYRDPAAALALIDHYHLADSLPPAVLHALGTEPELGKVIHAERDVLAIIGDNALAVEAAASGARSLGLHAEIVWNAMQGEAEDLGREFVCVVAGVSEGIDVVVGGGEATVTVRGNGRGGRNTEFALAAGLELERRGIRDWVVASLGTDGQDAMTGLAGAIADAGSGDRARQHGVDPAEALARNDSVAVFDVAGGAVKTGPTGTNVNDLYVAVRMRRSTC